MAITSLHLAEKPCSPYHPPSGSQDAQQATERFLEITGGPAEKQPPLNILQHSLNGFQQCESFICETPKEIASSCHCKRGNLRHAQCNYSLWELPKTTGWHPIAGGSGGGQRSSGRSCRISPAVCGQDFDVLSPLSTAHPHSISGLHGATGVHQQGWRQR